MRPALLSDLPRPVQVQLAVGGPLLLGMVVGFFLGISAPVYWALTAAAVLGGLMNGLEHRGARTGAKRGLIAGTLFGLGVVVAHTAADDSALAPLPSPLVLFVPLSAVIGSLLSAAGGKARERSERPGAARQTP